MSENKAEVKPYNNSQSKKSQVSKMFDNIAPWYDFLNHFLSLGIDITWRKAAIESLKPYNPRKILDVATGTADLAIEAAKQLSPELIIGVDIANEMLEIGRKKIDKPGIRNIIELRHGDSEKLPFEDNTFDAVTVAFGVRNFEKLQQGITEMHRVLAPKGRLVILEFSKPTLFPFKQLFNLYFKYILPLIGRVTSKDPKAYEYLYQSVQEFPDGQNFVDFLQNIGFQSIKHKPLTLGICTLYCGNK
jgi:demethylmenaquinone methyltransferase/2-methoxy-6-polyprenyl-1,4-benzoquinol methylase